MGSASSRARCSAASAKRCSPGRGYPTAEPTGALRHPGPRWFDPRPPDPAGARGCRDVVGGLRALLLQSLHPQAMIAVAQHSDYRNDPWAGCSAPAPSSPPPRFGAADDARRAPSTTSGTSISSSPAPAPTAVRTGRTTAPAALGCTWPRPTASFAATSVTAPVRSTRPTATVTSPTPPGSRSPSASTCRRPARNWPRSSPPTGRARATPEALEAARFLVWNPPLRCSARGPYSLLAGTAIASCRRGRGGRCGCPVCRWPSPCSSPPTGRAVVGAIRWAMAARRAGSRASAAGPPRRRPAPA